MKIGPPIAMLGVVGLAVYLMLGPLSPRTVPLQPGQVALEIGVAQKKLRVVQSPAVDPPGSFTYRVLNDPDFGAEEMSADDFQQKIAARGAGRGRSWVLRLFNVSSYANLLWVALGFGGQAVFAGRMWVQWIASERARRSVVPAAFWYMSLAGGLTLTAYFIWRQDLVGVVGQASGVVIYFRNIRFLRLHRPVNDQGRT
jgi:lipid-A-disaccharide synthase-like uncharacterized protein